MDPPGADDVVLGRVEHRERLGLVAARGPAEAAGGGLEDVLLAVLEQAELRAAVEQVVVVVAAAGA